MPYSDVHCVSSCFCLSLSFICSEDAMLHLLLTGHLKMFFLSVIQKSLALSTLEGYSGYGAEQGEYQYLLVIAVFFYSLSMYFLSFLLPSFYIT